MTRCSDCNRRKANMMYRLPVSKEVEPLCELCAEKFSPRPEPVYSIA